MVNDNQIKTNCQNHAKMEELIYSNNSTLASLVGQMKILLWVLSGCGCIIAAAITAQISNTIELHNTTATALNTITSNSKKIKMAQDTINKHELRITHIEDIIE